MPRAAHAALITAALLTGCDPPRSTPPAPDASPAVTASVAAEAPRPPALAVREGGALVRSPDGAALYLADEDHATVRRIPLPLDEATPPRSIAMPGRPAQVLGVGDRVLVTVRDPGLLVVLRDRGGALAEEGRVVLPADAWGIAVTADGARALVTSAWTHQVSLIDLPSREVRWSVSVAREPRGVAVRADGSAAWITHLTGADLTRVDDLGAAAPTVRRVAFPADPSRAPAGQGDRVSASLGYAAVLSADEGRLFVARHALGALGWDAWFGSTTVDVLGTAASEPLASPRAAPGMATAQVGMPVGAHDRGGEIASTDAAPFAQPRAMVLRKAAGTLLVASEGHDTLVELDARAVAPALAPLRIYALAGPARRVELFRELETRWGGASHGAKIPDSACGAPSGVALSPDEATAYVYCRSTDGLAVVPLASHGVGPAPRPYRREETYVVAKVAADPLPEAAARGRRLFYDALDPVVSGGLGCAGCHPDGRDDGHVWREVHPEEAPRTEPRRAGDVPPPFFVAAAETLPAVSHDAAGTLGRARQTPMLAGRVDAPGPYGWQAESSTLVARIVAGFALHRWAPSAQSIYDLTMRRRRAEPIAAFLREGLVPPPARGRALDAEEQRGREIFTSETAGCARCHDPANGYTNRAAMPLPLRRRERGFEPDRVPVYKVPSLFYVGSTAPYYHDGAAATLEDLVEQNLDHMGMTSHLSADERRALIAFLRSIEPDRAGTASAAPADAPAPWKPEATRALPPDERGPSTPSERAPSDDALAAFDAEPWPESASPAPSKAEWSAAAPVRLSRSAAGCVAKRVREWVRVTCDRGNHLMLAGGTRAGLTLDANPELDVRPTVTFPVRRGDRRVIELSSWWKWQTPLAVLSEQWLAGDARPLITFDALYSSGVAVLP